MTLRRAALTSTLSLATLAGALVAPVGPAAAAEQCTPSRAMIILDKSSSMTAKIGGRTKWQIAVAALDQLTATFQARIDLGLMVFPNPDECSPGQVNVDVGPSNRAAMMGALGAAPPSSGNWTPMSQTLDVAAGVPSLNDPARRRSVVLVTDGWQWCYPYDDATRFDPVESVQALRAKGITTYVVGFGDAVDALALNRMAVAGGTAPPGCDPTGDAPMAPSPCYYRAENAAALEAALADIGISVSAETCDGVDNDCDGLVDEELVRACSTACGTGSETCAAGAWSSCDAPTPAAEICDGIDSDCDGTTDPGCACQAGQTRPCGAEVGACAPGTQPCNADGTWGDCAGAIGPQPELCNGADDDCDGRVDEGDAPASSSRDDVELAAPCPDGLLCIDGGCVVATDPPVAPSTPVADDDGLATGCGCRIGGGPGAAGGGALAALLLGVVALGRRRRQG